MPTAPTSCAPGSTWRAPNINLRDPAIYRIRHATHHNTGDKWCVYPMYTYAHPIEDALENITHSICTLEFEDQRPFYDWLLERLAEGGLLQRPLPQQIEFSRLNLTYIVLSKRKLIQLVEERHVDGWDDPRMPTLVGARRRGYAAAGFRLFAERIGVSKNDSLIDYVLFEDAQREVMNLSDERRIAVLDPLRLVIDNYPEGLVEECLAPNHPLKPELGKRAVPFGKELWIEAEDFMEEPGKGYHRLYPGNMARLRYGYVVKCTGCDKDESGKVVAVHCDYLPETRSGTPGADSVKVKGNLHWVAVAHACAAEIRLYDRPVLFRRARAGGRRARCPRRHQSGFAPGDHRPARTGAEGSARRGPLPVRAAWLLRRRPRRFAAGAPVFNRAVTLRDSWGKAG